MAEAQLRMGRGIGKHYLEAGAGQTWCSASWSWDLQASGTGMWQFPLLSLPASSGSRTPLPPAPPVWELFPGLNEELITLGGEINWSESCLGWLSSCLCGLAAIRSKSCDCVSSAPSPTIHCWVQAAIFFFLFAFQKLFGL